MKVLILNGSPHKEGCTYTALKEVEQELNNNKIDTDWVWIGTKPVQGCIGCHVCQEKGTCIFKDKLYTEISEKLLKVDAFIVGSPVYYGSANGTLCTILDRVFYSNRAELAGKFGAAVVSTRRAGTTTAYDRITRYFSTVNMPVVTSQYWNLVHGNTPEEVKQDLEGLQTMRTLAKNMAWLLKSTENTEKPTYEETIYTNFIR